MRWSVADSPRRTVRVLRITVIGAVLAASGTGLIRWLDRQEVLIEAAARAPLERRIRVEILNGGGRSGMARAATDELRAVGFDVVDMGNATEFDRDSSVVLDRVGDLDAARGVAESLGIRSVETQIDSSRLLEVSVLLGAEWEPLEVRTSSGVGETGGPWWDLRRFWK